MLKVWCDFIEREFLENNFQDMIDKKMIFGATSNPSIFANTLSLESYRNDIKDLRKTISNPKEIYESLVFQDIKMAAKALLPLYKKNQDDGYISIEIDPNFCDSVEDSLNEGIRIFETLNCENVMIKVPASSSGFNVMQKLLEKNIPVNATLIFTNSQMQECLRAFNEAYTNTKTNARAVISVFVSRFDREMDDMLENKGQYAIFNAINIYNNFKKNNINPNFRILFASTGVKNINETYKDKGYYVYPLAFSDCINTMPLDTIRSLNLERIKMVEKMDFTVLRELENINLEKIESRLFHNGVEIFKNSFNEMLEKLKNT